MSEITNLNVKLQNNPFAGYIIPLIEYFNDPHVRARSPFEALAAAALMANRQTYWTEGNPPSPERLNFRQCCCGGSNGGCIWLATIFNCPPCDGLNTAKVTQSGPTSLYNLLVSAAAEVNVGNPWTPAIRNFEAQLAGMSMNSSNDWIFMQQMVDVFYENVDFVSYFTNDYESGVYAGIFTSLVGGTFRDGYNPTGLLVETTTDGTPSVPATPGKTDITFNSTDPGDENSYYVIYTDATNATVFWYNFGGGAEPVVVIPGVSVVYVEYLIDPALPPADFAVEIQNQSIGIIGFDSVTQVDVSTVRYVTSFNGLRTTSDFAAMPVTWDGVFVDGTAVVAGTGEATKISYAKATAPALVGSWFKMFGAADDGILFYYEKAGVPINPASFGVAYASAIAIPLNERGGNCNTRNCDGYCYQDVCYPNASTYVQKVTNDAIIGTGLFAMGAVDGCCKCNSKDDPANCCGPCDTFIAVTDGDFPNAEGGTSAIGSMYQVNDVLAPDGTNFGTAVDDRDYAYVWNIKVVPHMKALGRPTHYLKSVIAFPCICCIQSICPSGCIIIDCPDFQEDTARVGSLMLQTSYLSVTENLKFNTTGVSSWNGPQQCKTCLI